MSSKASTSPAPALEPFAPLSTAAFCRQMIARGGGSRCCACRTRKAREKIPIGTPAARPDAGGDLVGVCSAACAYLLGRWAVTQRTREEAGGDQAFDHVDDRAYDRIAARFHLVETKGR